MLFNVCYFSLFVAAVVSSPLLKFSPANKLILRDPFSTGVTPPSVLLKVNEPLLPVPAPENPESKNLIEFSDANNLITF